MTAASVGLQVAQGVTQYLKIMTLEEQIDQKIGEVRTEPLDLSLGEMANLHRIKELIIQPEYQRLFRWSEEHLMECRLEPTPEENQRHLSRTSESKWACTFLQPFDDKSH